MKLFAPVVLLIAGIFLLIGGSSLADSEENIANSVGSLVSNTWFAAGLIIAGGLWLYMTTGHFRRITA